MKKVFTAVLAIAILISGCKAQKTPDISGNPNSLSNSTKISATSSLHSINNTSDKVLKTISLVNPSGETLQSRILPPKGYKRTKAGDNSLTTFLRNYEMNVDGSSVHLYNGWKKWNQSAHIAVFKLPIENEDLQQCADSVMRVYGEYYYQNQNFDKIKFKLGGGFIADFDKWRKGYAISVSGNKVSWVPSSKCNSSYESFKKFMRIVFAYSGTLNMEGDSEKIPLSKANVGDIFIKGGSPGHVVMIVDICKNSKEEKAYLLGQGYMPAQEFHLLKNPLHEDDPWYYEEEINYPLNTPEYTFDEGSLRKYKKD